MNLENVQNQIVVCHGGSLAYGTNTPTSDVDIRGIFCAEEKAIRTPFHIVREINLEDQEDGKLYELSNFMKLYCDMNPNILELLWVDSKSVLSSSPAYEHLRSYAPQLLSSKCAFTFSGYAVSQLKRIKGHNKWINNPQPVDPPKHGDFLKLVQNSTGEQIFSRDFTKNYKHYLENNTIVHYGGDIFGVVKDDGATPICAKGDFNVGAKQGKGSSAEQPLYIIKYCADEYRRAKEVHKNYWTWKNNRNPVRAELEEKYGADCYSDDTEFLTESGWKNFDEVTDGMKVATFNKGHKVVFQEPVERYCSLYTGNMYNFKGTHKDTLVTAGHRMYTRDFNRNTNKSTGTWKFEDACRLRETCQFLNTINPKINIQKLPEGCYEGELDLLPYLKLMGWFVSDGCISFRDGKVKSLRLSQSKPNSGFLHAIRKAMNKGTYDCKHYRYPPSGISNYPENTFTFKRSIAESLYKDCGHGSKNKRLPTWVFLLTRRMMKTLLTGLLQGDGTKRENGTYIYYTCNKCLADDVQRLAFMCGYKSSLWGPYNTSSDFSVDSTMYQVFIDDKANNTKVYNRSSLEKVHVVDKRVVCFSVPNGTLVTRRNGKIDLQGNCKHVSHSVRLLRMCEEILTEGVVNVMRPDAEELLAIRNGAWTYDEVIAWADMMDEKIKGLYKTTHLPKKVDINLATKVLLETQDMIWKG